MAETSNHRVVLLVDDDVLIRNLVRRNLETAGFLVLSAAHATEALAISRACPDRIDALLVDVEIPGTDGVTLAQQITRERTDTLVLLMSGGTMRTIPEQMAFISKPFLPAELLTKLADVLARGSDTTSYS